MARFTALLTATLIASAPVTAAASPFSLPAPHVVDAATKAPADPSTPRPAPHGFGARDQASQRAPMVVVRPLVLNPRSPVDYIPPAPPPRDPVRAADLERADTLHRREVGKGVGAAFLLAIGATATGGLVAGGVAARRDGSGIAALSLASVAAPMTLVAAGGLIGGGFLAASAAKDGKAARRLRAKHTRVGVAAGPNGATVGVSGRF